MRHFINTLFVAVLCFASPVLRAQAPYTFTTFQQTYVPLSSGIQLNSAVWFNTDYFVLPVPFPFKFDTITAKHPFIEGGTTLISDTGKGLISAFFTTNSVMVDKGFLGSDLVSLSPIRYEVDGVNGNRIFKVETANAGFFSEVTYHTSVDSCYMQIWMYENSNIIEFHYGPSQISHSYSYFPTAGKPFIGYVSDVDYYLDGIYYSLTGDPVSPSVDTVTADSGNFVRTPLCVTTFPAGGTVYRFTPNPTIPNSVQQNSLPQQVHIYPTACHDELFIDYQANEEAYYRIISITGATTQYSGKLSPNMNTLNVGNLPQGNYIIELHSNAGAFRQRFTRI